MTTDRQAIDRLAHHRGHESLKGYNFDRSDGIFAEHSDITAFSEALAAVESQNGQWGFINNGGVEVTPLQFTLAWGFNPNSPHFTIGLAGGLRIHCW
jgi:hypothetical protein